MRSSHGRGRVNGGGGGGRRLAHPDPVPCRPEVGVKVKAREANPPRHVPDIVQAVPVPGKSQSYPHRASLSGATLTVDEVAMKAIHIAAGIIPAMAATLALAAS